MTREDCERILAVEGMSCVDGMGKPLDRTKAPGLLLDFIYTSLCANMMHTACPVNSMLQKLLCCQHGALQNLARTKRWVLGLWSV